MRIKPHVLLLTIFIASCGDESSNTTNSTTQARIDDTYNISIQNVHLDPFEIDAPTAPGSYSYQRSWLAGTEKSISGSFEIRNSGSSHFAGVIGIQYTCNGAYVQIQWGHIIVNLAPGDVKSVTFNKELNLPGTSINVEEIPNPQYFRIFVNSDDNGIYIGGPMRFDIDLDNNIYSHEFYYRTSGGG